MHTRSLVLMAVVFAFAGCASRSGITRVDPQSTIDLSGYWNDADANQVADVMIEDCIRNGWAEKWSAAHPGSPPVIRLFPIRNRSSDHINDLFFTKQVEAALLQTGRVRVVANYEEAGDNRFEREAFAAEVPRRPAQG